MPLNNWKSRLYQYENEGEPVLYILVRDRIMTQGGGRGSETAKVHPEIHMGREGPYMSIVQIIMW